MVYTADDRASFVAALGLPAEPSGMRYAVSDGDLSNAVDRLKHLRGAAPWPAWLLLGPPATLGGVPLRPKD